MTESPRTTGRANLYRIDGSRRPDAEVLAESGNIGLRLALLDDAMHRRASSPEADALYPPRLFLSYKWGSAADDQWVRDLAERLTRRGWDVVFDRRRDQTVDPKVEDFVSRLTSCRVFVAVLSPAYVASAFDSDPTWVFDEIHCAVIAHDRMRLIAIVPPNGPTLRSIAEFDEVHEVREDHDLERFLDASLTYSGPRLDETERAWVSERLARTTDEASLRAVIERHPFVSGAWRRLVVLLRDRGELEAALETAGRALDSVHEPVDRLPFLHEQIELRKRSGNRLGAAQAAIRLIDQRPRDWVAHYHLGDLLDDANDPWPARGHLLLACADADAGAAAHNTLGVIYMGAGLLARAAQSLENALRIDSTLVMARRNLDQVRASQAASTQADVTEVSGPLPGCSKCDAIFVQQPDRRFLCAACGASKPEGVARCAICGGDALAPIVRAGNGYLPTRCPICRTGTITAKERARL